MVWCKRGSLVGVPRPALFSLDLLELPIYLSANDAKGASWAEPRLGTYYHWLYAFGYIRPLVYLICSYEKKNACSPPACDTVREPSELQNEVQSHQSCSDFLNL